MVKPQIERIDVFPSLELGNYLLKHQRVDGSFGNLEETYWAVMALSYLNMVDATDKEGILRYVLDCKRINGFAASSQESEIDLHSFFYAINTLYLIKKQEIILIDEYEDMFNNISNFQKKNGGFSHCNLDFCPICKGKASLKSTYYAIYSLKLLYDINSTQANKILAFLSKTKSKKDGEQAFRLLSLLLLDHIEDIDETSINHLMSLQEQNGSFGTIEHSFWVLYCLYILKRLRNINKGKIFEFLRSCQKQDKSFSAAQSIETHQLNIRTTAWATMSFTLLWNELVEFIEQKILKEIYTSERVLIEELAEQCYVRFDLIIYVIKKLMKYDWFRVEIRDTIDIFKRYVERFDAISRKIAVTIVKYIVNQNVVNLSEIAKGFSATDYSKALQRVIAVATNLIKEKFIIGEIKWNKRFFRVTGFLNGVLPGKALVRVAQIPYHEVTVEKGQIPVEQRRIMETIEQIQPITERIKSDLDNLLDLNEVELAKVHLRRDITGALEILNSSNKNIETNVSKFQYLNGEYTHYLMKDWVSVYHKSKESLLQIEKEYLKKIEKKERIVKILKDLEDFQEFVQKQLNNITTELNNTQKLFQQACEEKFELKKDEIKRKLDDISISVERITPQLREQAANLFKATGELRRTQDASQLNTLQPLEKWLESMWMKKRKNTIKIIKDMKGQLNGREELKENIKNRRELFDFKLRDLSNIINSIIESTQFNTANTTLNERTEEILNYLSETNQYVLNFIQDTASYLEGFQLTVDDIFENWSKSLLENMRNELVSIKSDLETKILSKKELDQNEQLNSLVEKIISELKKATETMEQELLLFVEGPKVGDTVKEIKRKISKIEEVTKSSNNQINSFIKKTAQEFPNFPETSQITLHKWTLFQDSLKRAISLNSDKIKNELILRVLFSVAPIFHGGRVKLDYLASKINLKKDEIEDRAVYLISIGKLEAQFNRDHNEIVPLTQELKQILNFERMIKVEMETLKTDYTRTRRLFETSCRKKQLDDSVIEEIISRTRGVLSRKYKTEITIEKRIKDLPSHIDLDLLLERWSEQKIDVERSLSLIKQKITQRLKFKEKLLQYINEIKTEMKEMANPIDVKVDFGEMLEAGKMLSKSINLIEHLIKKFDQDLKMTVEKISNDLDRFDLVVADLLTRWAHEKTKLKTGLSDLNARLQEKINEGLTLQWKKELRDLINNCNIVINNFIYNYIEKDAALYIQKGEIYSALSYLQNFHKKFTKIEKNSQDSVSYYVNKKSKSLKSFKDAANTLVSRWELAKLEHQKTFQENYLQLENQIIIKYLQIQQTVYSTRSLDLGAISKELHIKKNELRQRFVSLIAAEKLTGKINPNTDKYLFPSNRIEEARPERPPVEILREETPSVLKGRLFDKITEIFKTWYPVIGSAGSIVGASAWIYSATQNILFPILLPGIVFPTLLIYVFYKHRKEKKGS